MQGFEPLPAQVDLPALEREVLARWQDAGIFERSLKQTVGGQTWVFYEGPPTANGLPGVHHVEARTFKDLFPRFKTMQGFHVPRRAGWDCHGLPVEVAVEKELGFTGKHDIEAYGIAEFNARCRESVLRYVDAWLAMSRRMGYWADTEHAYRTMDASYVESVWWSLKAVFDAPLPARDFRISRQTARAAGRRCPTPSWASPMSTSRSPTRPSRSGSGCSPCRTGRRRSPGRRSAGVDHDALDAGVQHRGGGPPGGGLRGGPAPRGRRPGGSGRRPGRAGARRGLAGFRPVLRCGFGGGELPSPFGMIKIPDAHVVVPGSFVTTEDGTGLVHLAPAFGAEDMEASRAHGLPVVNPVKPDGQFEDGVPLVGGMFFKDADQRLIRIWTTGACCSARRHEHSYPHCWRCGTSLLYYALPSWYIKTTAIKDRLLDQNEQTNWYPATVKHGRYGEWLRNNVDWALSRTRYWGTPLPLWVCDEDHVTCVGSLAELSDRAGRT